MNYTQAQIDRANAVSLEDFLRSQGEQLIKSGREYRWKAHDSLTTETSSLPLKPPLICCLSSACIRRNGSPVATLLWAVCPARLWSVFSLNAGTFRKCSSVWIAIPQEAKPVSGF